MDFSVTVNTPVVNIFQVDITPVLDRLNELETLIKAQGATQVALIDDLEAKVTAVQGTEDSMATLLAAVHDELVAANANNPRVQAVIDLLETGQQRMLDAIAANPDPNAPATGP